MSTTKHFLAWKPESVAKLLGDNGIRDRNQLSKALNVGRTTVYSSFGPDWSGVASASVIAAMAAAFDAPVGELVDHQRAAA